MICGVVEVGGVEVGVLSVGAAAVVASVASVADASAVLLRMVGAVVTGAGPGALQAPLSAALSRRLGNQTIADTTNNAMSTIATGKL
jgi:hypothetical protein